MTDLVTEAPVGMPSPAASPKPQRPVRVAISGLNRAGVMHAAVLSAIPDCEVVGVQDPRSAARRNLRGLGYTAAGFESVDKMLAKTRPDALFVCGPHPSRGPTVMQAIETGIAVLVDRPLAANRAQAESLVRLAAEKSVPLACGHALVHHPVFAAARGVLAANVIGEIRQARASLFASWVFSSKQKESYAPHGSAGGVTVQPASDLLFLLCWYLGAPVEARATWNRIYGEYEDELHAMMKLPNGVEVGFDTSWSVPGYPRPATVIELEGQNGKLLVADDALEIELHASAAGFPAGVTRLGHASLPGTARFDLDGDAPYLMDASFLAWATGGDAPPSVAERAIEVMRVVEALYESARQGGRSIAVGA